MPATDLARRTLRASAHVSFFERSAEIYAYHDLWGWALAMDRTAYEMIRAFEGGARVGAVAERFRDRLPAAQVDGFVDTLTQHRVLVPPREDDRARAFAEGHPVLAAWGVRWLPKGAERGVLAYKDRALGQAVLEPLGPVGARLVRGCDGERTLADLADAIAREMPHRDPDEVRAEVRRLAFRLTHSDRQVLKLVERPLYSYLAFPPPHLRSVMPFRRLDEGADGAAARRAHAHAGAGAGAADRRVPADAATEVVDLARYHREVIADALEQFDVGETTLSHMFREPHPALDGRSYGEAFVAALAERALLPRALPGGRAARIVEIGGGVGFFAQAFTRALAARVPGGPDAFRYAILDLAPALQRSQRRLDAAAGGRLRFITADASRPLPFAAGSLDLVVSNEVIADLETVRLARGDRPPAAGAPAPARRGRGARAPRAASGGPEAAVAGGGDRRGAAWSLIERTGLPLDGAAEVFWLNLGALALVEDLARVLAPGGAAVLTEFGSERGDPVESTHLDHAEFSIAFGHLLHVARRAGLEAELVPILDLLDFAGGVRVLQTTRTWFEPARALFARRGVRLEKLAYTRDRLEGLAADAGLALDAIEEVKLAPVRERALGLRPAEFQALILRRPRAAARSGR